MPTDPKDNKKRAQTPAPWAKEGPGGRDFAQEDAEARLKLKSLKAKADAWAVAEKANIESGAKKPPMSSKEKIMAEKPKSEYTDFSNQKRLEPGDL